MFKKLTKPEDFKNARLALGLSVKQAAALMETDVTTIRRVERREDANTHRKPPVRMAALYGAYLAGYRPPEWPGEDSEVSELLGV